MNNSNPIKNIFYLLLFLAFKVSVSQSITALDSLKKELNKENHDSVKCKLLSLMVDVDFDDNAWPVHNSKVIAICKKYISEDSKVLSKQDSVFHLYYMNALSVEGFIQMNKGDYKSALKIFDRTIKMEKNNRNPGILAMVYNNIAGIHSDGGNLEQAKEYFEKCLKIGFDIKNDYVKAKAYGNISVCLVNDADTATKRNYLLEALKLYIKTNDKSGQAFVYNNLGRYYQSQKNYDAEIDAYKKAYQLNKEIGNNFGLCYLTSNISHFYSRINDNANAFKYANECFEIANALKYPELIKTAAHLLYLLESKKGNYKKALEHYTQYHVMSDSIRSSENLKASIKQKVQDDFDKKQIIEQAKHDQQMMLEKEKNEKQKLYTLFTGIGLLLFILFSIFIFTRMKLINNQKKLIELQKREVDKKNEIIEEKQKEIIDSINYAKRIQYALLAHDEYLSENLKNYFVYFQPKDIVSGDFYWATSVNSSAGNCFYLAVCDCTGHGVPGAFMSLLSIGFLSEAIKEKHIQQPGEIFNYVRKRLIENISKEDQKDGFDGILICINNTENKITYAAANNEPVLVSENNFTYLATDKMPVGIGISKDSFNTYELNYKKGDSLYIYTDGYADQFGGPKGKKFKYKQLNDLLLAYSTSDVELQKENLKTNFNSWKGNLEQVDDVCIIGIRL